MRSRTELVTTTFIDSEDDPSESDDSEEDWRPCQNGKRRSTKPSKTRRKKRKLNSSSHYVLKEEYRRQFQSPDVGQPTGYSIGQGRAASQHHFILSELTQEKHNSNHSGSFELFIYKKDLLGNYKGNSHLSLWRHDGMNLLQKFIRVKTTNPEEFIFTSSSVYSSWDGRRRKDFVTIAVKYMEENHRRITLVNPSDLVALANEAISRNRNSSANPPSYSNVNPKHDGNKFDYSNEEADDDNDDDEEGEEEDDDDDEEQEEEQEEEDDEKDSYDDESSDEENMTISQLRQDTRIAHSDNSESDNEG